MCAHISLKAVNIFSMDCSAVVVEKYYVCDLVYCCKCVGKTFVYILQKNMWQNLVA